MMKIIHSRKASVSAYPTLILAIIISIFAFAFGLFVLHLVEEQVHVKISQDITGMQYDLLLLDIFKAEYNGKNVAEIISEDYIDGRYDNSEAALKEILGKHAKDVSDWELFVEGKKRKDSCNIIKCNGKKQSSSAFIPLSSDTKSNIIVTLNVYTKK